MINNELIECITVSSTLKEGDRVVESCGDSYPELSGYYVIVRKEDLDDFAKAAAESLGGTYLTVISDSLNTDSAKDLEDTFAMVLDDDIESYTEMLLNEFGTAKNVIEALDDCNGEFYEEEEREEEKTIIDVDSKQMEEEDLKNESNNLETIVKDLEQENREFSETINNLNVENNRLKKEVDRCKELLDFTEVPDFAIDSTMNLVNNVNTNITSEALILTLQELSNSEKDKMVLSRVIELLAINYSELGAISFE